MARKEQDREDLMAEVSALVPRLAVVLPNESALVVVGFRGEAPSFYFGEDPVFHLTSDGKLRRGFVEGRLLVARGSHLVRLTRQRTPDRVLLVPEPLEQDEESNLLSDLHHRLDAMRQALDEGTAEIRSQVPVDGEAVDRLTGWLSLLPPSIQPATGPRLR